MSCIVQYQAVLHLYSQYCAVRHLYLRDKMVLIRAGFVRAGGRGGGAQGGRSSCWYSFPLSPTPSS
eukprot:1778628-Rhodomonas_salina.3